MNFLFLMLSAATTAPYNPDDYDLGLVDGLISALSGYGMVFAGLIALMIVVIIMGALFSRKKKAKATKATLQSAPAMETAVEVITEAPVAPGTAGQLKLHDVNPKTAAMLMAIVADKMGKPLNELRFISIKEVK